MKSIDWLLAGPVAYLLLLSLIVLKSVSTSSVSELDFNFTTQVVAVVCGLGLMFLAMTQARIWLRLGPLLYLLSLLLLVAVAVYGQESGGATRWLSLGQFQLQPSELAKLSLILLQARLLTRRRNELNSPGPILLSAGYLSLIVAFIFLQPDLGTVLLIIAVWLCQLFISDLPKRTFLLLVGLLLLAIPAAYPWLADYQKARIDAFFNPSISTRAEGYNVLQATIAIGSGGIWGKGLDAGSQSQLNFLPAQHTDFIFAVVAEKLGFLGALSIVLAFCVLLCRMVVRVARSSSRMVQLVGYGVVGSIGAQFVINIGMNLGLIPVTGVPLPFISAGGTHIIVELAMLGLLAGLTKSKSGSLQI